MKAESWIALAVCLLEFALALPACSHGDDDDSGGDDDDDESDDDAAADDDAADDDNDDNDTSPDRVSITMVDGGGVGYYGAAFDVAPDGTRYLAATRDRRLLLHQLTPDGKATVQTVDRFGFWPSLAADSSSRVHLAYQKPMGGGLVYAHAENGQWIYEDVEASPVVTGLVVLRLDHAGAVHLLYISEADDALRHATNQSGAWVREAIAPEVHAVYGADLALDSQGRAHVAYRLAVGYFSAVQFYATNQSGEWRRERLDVSNFAATSESCALAVDESDRPYVAYVREMYDGGSSTHLAVKQNGQWRKETLANAAFGQLSLRVRNGEVHLWRAEYDALTHLTNASGEWAGETVDSGDRIECVDGRIDDAGDLHVGYYRMGDSGVYCALQNARQGWQRTEVARAPRAGYDIHAAVDSSDHTRLSYHAGTIRTALNDLGGWQFTDAPSATYHVNNFTIDADGATHFCYYGYVGLGLTYAKLASGEWHEELVDPNGDGFAPCGVAVDPAGAAHLVYSNDVGLAYATNASGLWTTQVFGGPPANEHNMGFVADGDGAVHVAWRNQSVEDGSQVVYATNAGGTWMAEIVAALHPFFELSGIALAVDPMGAAHVVYADYHANGMEYATNVSGAWETETIALGVVGVNPQIQVDAARAANIVFYQPTATALAYVTNLDGAWTGAVIDRVGDAGRCSALLPDGLDKLVAYYMADQAVWQATFPVGYTGEQGVDGPGGGDIR